MRPRLLAQPFILVLAGLVLMAVHVGQPVLAGGAGQAQPTVPRNLGEAIVGANWQRSMHLYYATPVRESLPTLKALAGRNVVMAQWFLADALAVSGQHEEASKWLYAASLGTRMDASLCQMDNAELVEYRFVREFSSRFDKLRANPNWRRIGLEWAIVFHKDRLDQSSDSGWVCQLLANEGNKVPRRPLRPTRYWAEDRQDVLEDYQEQTGLDFSRSPDLMRINPVN